MPRYQFVCPKCRRETERMLGFEEFDRLKTRQRCECGGVLQHEAFTDRTTPVFIGRKKPGSPRRPRVRGFESGPTGFMKRSQENDGCTSAAQRKSLARNATAEGVNVAGGVFVPGLCRRGKTNDPYAVVHSLGEAVAKAEQLGRCVEGAVNYESSVRDEHLARTEQPYRCSPDLVRQEVEREIREKHGGKVTKTRRRDIVEKHIAVHSGN